MDDNTQNPQDLVQNPIGEGLDVEVRIPKKIEIKMVDASSLNEYEVWLFIASLTCNFLVGFVVATISEEDSRIRSILTIIDFFWGVLLIVALLMVHAKRKKMSIETSIIPLSVKKKP